MYEIVRAAKKPEAKRENKISQTKEKCSSQSICSPGEQILFLQRTVGNQAVARLIESGALQAKLRIGAPGDVYEQEADRVAEQVMRMTEPAVQLKPGCHFAKGSSCKENEKILQAKEVSGDITQNSRTVESQINRLRGGGQPLHESVIAFFEPRFGHDFSGVRVHKDTKAAEAARAVNARAFTMGREVVFGEGQYAPETSEGRRLITHELTHSVQQSGKAESSTVQRKIVMHSGLTVSLQTEENVKDYIADIGVGNHEFDDIVEAVGKEYSFISGPTPEKRKAYRKRLIESIILDMHKSSDALFYNSDKELVYEIRKRAVTSLDMRVSQGKSRGKKPTDYPPRTADSWAAIAGSEAAPYWVVTVVTGDYNFTLSALGKNNAYEALVKLIFAHKTEKSQRSLMHCDYLVSAIHYKVMAESMGSAIFDKEVKDGNIQIKLQDMSIGDILQKNLESEKNKSLWKVELNSENELIIGDHVIFYNHPAYDDLNKNIGQSWRLENAIIIDNEGSGKTKRFQGHGYFSPKTRGDFIIAMRDKFNTLVTRADALVRANNIAGLERDFSFTIGSATFRSIDYSVIGGRVRNAKIKYIEGSTEKELPLTKLKSEDYKAPFVKPGETKISVWRPMESRLNY